MRTNLNDSLIQLRTLQPGSLIRFALLILLFVCPNASARSESSGGLAERAAFGGDYATAHASSFTTMKHETVQGRVIQDLRNLIGQTRRNVGIVLTASSASFETPWTQRDGELRILQSIFWLVLLIVIGRIARHSIFGQKMRRSDRSALSSQSGKRRLSRLLTSTKK